MIPRWAGNQSRLKENCPANGLEAAFSRKFAIPAIPAIPADPEIPACQFLLDWLDDFQS